MKKTEIQELLDLKGWSRTQLAASLDLTENAVNRWFVGDRQPGGPAGILMRQWLAEARTENGHAAKSGKKVAV